MFPFEYEQATDQGSAVQSVATSSFPARFLAGGTTLIDLMKLNVEQPTKLVDVTSLPLNQIQQRASGVVIGAMVKNSDLAHDPVIRQRFPVLSEALLSGASAQLRNMATTGGNILQRTRCYYFRDTSMPCNKREPGSGCSAIDGYNRIHAVLGTSSHCIASNPSDMNVAMAALDAVVLTQGPNGQLRIKFTDFHTLPGDHPEIESVLQKGELITGVEIPFLPATAKSHYTKVRDRASYAFALASAAVVLDQDPGGTVRGARIALGGVGAKPWRCFDAEKQLIGKPATADSFRAAAETALKGAKKYKDNGFKVELAKRTLVRTLEVVSGMADAPRYVENRNGLDVVIG